MQEKLLVLRNRHKLSQKQVADILGLSAHQYRLKEQGRYEFTADEMFKLSDLFNERLENIFLPRGHRFGDSIEGDQL